MRVFLTLVLLLTAQPVWAGEFLLTWQDRADNEQGFELERKLEGETDFSVRALLTVDIERYLDDAVPVNTQVQYRVRAWNMCCKPQPCEADRCVSDWSNTVSGMLAAEPSGDPPGTLLALDCARLAEPEPASPYTLFVSSSPTRADPIPLDGETVRGEVYIFVGPETDIAQARFWLDDTSRASPARQTESISPFDFAGSVGGTGTDALPFDTSTVADGEHTVSAEVDADAQWVLESTFMVQQ